MVEMYCAIIVIVSAPGWRRRLEQQLLEGIRGEVRLTEYFDQSVSLVWRVDTELS